MNILDKNHLVKANLRYVLCGLLLIFSLENLNAQDANEVRRRKAERIYYEAVRQINLGNITDGFQLLLHSSRMDSTLSAPKYHLSNFYRELLNDSVASIILKDAVAKSPDNYWYKYALVDSYAKQDNTDEALAVVEQMLEQYPNKEDVLMMAYAMYKQNQDYANVIKILDRLEIKEGKNEGLSMEKYKTFLQMEDKDNAFKEIQALVNEYPNDYRYKVLMGDLYLSNDENAKAYSIYKDVQGKDSSNVAVMASLLNYYSKTNQNDEYQNLVERISTNPQLDNETRLRFLTSLAYKNINENEDSTLMINIFEQVLAMPQSDTQVAELYVKYMLTRKMGADKVKPVLNQILLIDPTCDVARNQMLVYLIDEEDTDGIIRICKPAVEYSSENPLFYYYLGVAYEQTDKRKEALEVLKKGVALSSLDEMIQLKIRMLTFIGDIYSYLCDMKHAYEAYDSCLILKPDESHVLNNYAYFLSLELKNLDKAEKMSKKTLEQEPESPTFLDTYAWILFQQKKYSESKVYIDKAIKVMNNNYDSDDAGIIEHAGDIYAKNGMKQKAVEFWQLSSDLGNDSPILVKKLKKQKYYVY